MLEYKLVTIKDKNRIKNIFEKANRRGNEYTFSNLFNWSKALNIKIAQYKNNIIFNHSEKAGFFSFPIGNENLSEAVKLILEECHKNNTKVNFVNVDDFDVQLLNYDFPNIFSIEERRSDFDYIYKSSDLSELKGKKYHCKRNHISKFLKKFPNWRFEIITEKNLKTAEDFCSYWYLQNESQKSKTIKQEKIAVQNAFKYYFELGLLGGILFVDNNPIACTFGSKSSDDTFVVHTEKALTDYDGSYTVINQEFSKYIGIRFKYINREDDMGIEGLRTSKLSYRPTFMYKRYYAKEV